MATASSKDELFEFEIKINRKIPRHPWIRVRNDVDNEYPPRDFTLTLHNIDNSTIKDQQPLVGCHCQNCGKSKQCCPMLAHGGKILYNADGLLDMKLAKNSAIYECNTSCDCTYDCINKVVQKGTTLRMEIFKTNDGRGWGLKTLEDIKKGQFVIEYVGELLIREQAERKETNGADCSYFFDLQYGDCESPFIIDAGAHGNASRFINHSCSPNLVACPVYVNQLDARLPRLALFALENICKYTELTFDYLMKKSEKGGVNPCRCGAAKCKKFFS